MEEENGLCCLCGLPYERIGNNPYPLSFTGRCCDACDEIVIEARIDETAVAKEVVRVEEAIKRKQSDGPLAMALAAICVSRGPGLLAMSRRINDETEEF